MLIRIDTSERQGTSLLSMGHKVFCSAIPADATFRKLLQRVLHVQDSAPTPFTL